MKLLQTHLEKKRKEKDIQRKRKGLSRAMRDDLSLLLLCLPGLAFLIIFHYVPMGGIIIAFKNYVPRKGLFGSEWVGLKNFEFFFKSQDAWRTIRNTVLYSLDFLAVDLVVGITMALMLYHLRSRRGLKAYHTIILLPKFISITIVSFMVYAILSPSYGVLNHIIVALGGEKIQWYAEAKYWPVILTLVHIWQIAGSGSLYYYSSLVGVDTTLFEAAAIDGAGTWKKIWHVALPHLIPIATMMTILGLGHIFSGSLGLHYQVTRNQGLLYPTTDIVNTYTYRALLGGDLDRSAAVGLAQNVVGLVLVVGVNQIVRKISPENAMF